MDLEYCYQKFNYQPHRGQRKVHEACRKFRKNLILFGRRGGKSFCSAFESALGLIEPPHPFFGSPCGLITAPTSDLTKAVFERSHDLIFRNLSEFEPKYSRTDRYIELKRLGSRLYVRSGDKPKQVVSRGYSFVVVDESGFYRDDTFRELEPALLERRGKLIAIGVPALQNWYQDLYRRIKRGEDDGHIIQLPSVVNPSISIKEWHRLYKQIPRDEFLRQYCAKFIEDSATVWRIIDLERSKLWGDSVQSSEKNLENPLSKVWEEEPVNGCEYVAGIDLARKTDYTVITILKINKPFQVVASLRIQGSWTNQVSRIADFLHYYNCQACTIDATGIGDAVIEQLSSATPVGLNPFVFTNDSKSQVIDSLTLLLEQGKIKIPETLGEYHKEMRVFEYEVSKTGLRVFNAPDGFHDDCVISLALAVRCAQYDYIS